MKENNKLVVFYSAKKDAFLRKYKDRGSLAFEASFSEDLNNALSMPVEPYEEQKTELDKLAEAVGGKALIMADNQKYSYAGGTNGEP